MIIIKRDSGLALKDGLTATSYYKYCLSHRSCGALIPRAASKGRYKVEYSLLVHCRYQRLTELSINKAYKTHSMGMLLEIQKYPKW